jgi:hypothetical protein
MCVARAREHTARSDVMRRAGCRELKERKRKAKEERKKAQTFTKGKGKTAAAAVSGSPLAGIVVWRVAHQSAARHEQQSFVKVPKSRRAAGPKASSTGR